MSHLAPSTGFSNDVNQHGRIAVEKLAIASLIGKKLCFTDSSEKIYVLYPISNTHVNAAWTISPIPKLNNGNVLIMNIFLKYMWLDWRSIWNE